jgi:hypothetical protein
MTSFHKNQGQGMIGAVCMPLSDSQALSLRETNCTVQAAPADSEITVPGLGPKAISSPARIETRTGAAVCASSSEAV